MAPKQTVPEANRFPKMTIAAGSRHTVGLKADGTVLAAGDNRHGQCNVAAWHDISLPVNA